MSSIPLKCSCGQVSGEIVDFKGTGTHIQCACDDCQAYIHYLNKEDVFLDQFGFSEIYQVRSNQVRILNGEENIKCLRLSPKGIFRFYASCCHTPISNMIGLKMSFAGISRSFINLDDNEILNQLGPVTYHIMTEYALREVTEKSSRKFPLILTLKIVKQIIHGKIFKTYLPNSFYQQSNGTSKFPVSILSLEDKKSIKENIYKKIEAHK
ncbi:MAG: DUF6151 family protein [Bdellovibrionota bacterium]|nr:DUF6151 family protein [Bdellovibrionota bacterium]